MAQHESIDGATECGELQRVSISIFGREFQYFEGIPATKIVSFLGKVAFDESGCWLWMAGLYHHGYGAFSWQGSNICAHRFAWIAFRGFIEPGNHIHHLCRNPSCVNPVHLQSVTPADHLLEHTPKNPVYHNARAKFCKRGHPLFGDNMRVNYSDGHRRCKTCLREWAANKRIQIRSQRAKVEPTHCRNGHRITPENTYEWIGRKTCKLCHNATSTKSYAKLHPPPPPRPPKTHCVNGHAWIPENLYSFPKPNADGSTRVACAICHRESQNKAYRERKARYGKT